MVGNTTPVHDLNEGMLRFEFFWCLGFGKVGIRGLAFNQWHTHMHRDGSILVDPRSW